jgi:signal transduction histidine kinase
LEATTVNAPGLDAKVAARLQAAFADLASGHADRSSVEKALRALCRDAQAAGTGTGNVVVAVAEAATSAIETTRDNRWELVGRLMHLQEEERRRLAAEIHDDAIQAMAAAYLRAQLLGRSLTSPTDLESCEALERALKLSVQRLRRLTFELRPLALDVTTLARALDDYLGQVEFEAHVRVNLVDGLATEPCEPGRLVLYRAAQEALTNVAKHAGASTVTVVLSEDAGGYTLRIEDDGRGFRTAAASQRGLGLRLVRDRAEAVGGSCRVESNPGRGANVQVWVPRR